VTVSWYANRRDRTWTSEAASGDARAFHRSLEGYAPTPLVELPELAEQLSVGRVFAKDESSRLGLPAFKALGASWAVHRVLEAGGSDEPVTIVTATDGNHGRAVARCARILGQRSRVVIPEGVHPEAVQAIHHEGAEVIRIEGSYDDAVATAAGIAEAPGHVLVQDTAWPGYEDVPGWIVEGYSTLFGELDEQLADAGVPGIGLIAVPVGVGSLLQAAIAHYRRTADGPAIVSVEPDAAACVAPSLEAGHAVTVETGTTIMAGLNCGTLSSLAWPHIRSGLDAAIAVDDELVAAAATDLAALGVPAGPCGAAGLAALRAALSEDADERRLGLGLSAGSVVVLVITEGSDANPHGT
jgi:diaminopropionate ammonia-lyase